MEISTALLLKVARNRKENIFLVHEIGKFNLYQSIEINQKAKDRCEILCFLGQHR